MSNKQSIDVAHIAKLASLDLSEEEVVLFQDQLERVLEHVEHLNEVDINSDTNSVNLNATYASLREDLPKNSISHKKVIRNAPSSSDGCIRVPKIIDQ